MVYRGTTILFMETMNAAIEYAMDVIENPRCKVFKSEQDYIDSVLSIGVAPVSYSN